MTSDEKNLARTMLGMRRLTNMIAVAAAAAALTSFAPDAFAQTGAENKAAARALFEEGRKLVAEGKLSEACPKFEASQRLEPGAGVLFNLADCYEQIGRTASAWSLFLEVASMSKATNQADKEAAARTRASALEPKLSRLTISVPSGSEIEGLLLKRDGELVSKEMWNVRLPVDPGKHTLEATAPGKKKWVKTVSVDAGSTTAAIEVPALELAPADQPRDTVEPPPPAAAPPEKFWTTRRTIAASVAGIGVLATGVGGYLALSAKSDYDGSSDYCDGDLCKPQGLSIRSDAISKANTAGIIMGVGLAAVAAGAVVWFTAPSAPKEQKAGLRAGVAMGPGTVILTGAW